MCAGGAFRQSFRQLRLVRVFSEDHVPVQILPVLLAFFFASALYTDGGSMALPPCLFGEPITTTRSMRCSGWGSFAAR